MAKFEFKDFQKAISNELTGVKSVAVLGGLGRRNSYTFKVVFHSGEEKVIKLLKNTNGAEAKINDEMQSLKSLEKRTDIQVSHLIGSGEMAVKSKRMNYLLFSFYDGPVLSELTNRNGGCTEDDVMTFVNAMLKTIMQLASAGIIHQDIKPDNIVKCKNGDYILLDLGIAKFVTLDPKFVKQQGPAAYLSLEQVELGIHKSVANQRRITFLSDFNSLGIVALNMLLGPDFYSAWEVDRRHEASSRIREREIVNIEDEPLRTLLAALLEGNPSTRLYELRKILDFSTFQTSASDDWPRYWSLHKATGLTFLKAFAKENAKLKLGLVVSADAVNSIPNTLQTVEAIAGYEWKTAVDPCTHKLLFNADHHGHLKQKTYYHDGLLPESFYDTPFTQTFVSQVIEFERSLNPSLYISPYFFIRSHDDPLLSVGFNLFEECKKQLKTLDDNRPIAFGLCVSRGVLSRPADLDALADQIIVNPSVDTVYLNAELTKRDNTPCKDKDYLSGLKRLVERLAVTKNVIVAQGDQASLGLLPQERVLVAVNPNVSYRKNDIEDKLKEDKEEQGGGPKGSDRRYRVYVPKLMADLDITRDLNAATFKKLDTAQNITESKQSPYYNDAINIGDSEARNKHFTLEFNKQVESVVDADEEQSRKKFKKKVADGKSAYSQIAKASIKLDGDQTGDFLDVWEEVFL